MDKFNIITDIAAAGSLLLFTSADVALDQGTIIELVSKFGVVAVLWYWLKDLKAQLKDQLKEFREEAQTTRQHYDKILSDKKEEFQDYKDRIDGLLDKMIKEE